MEKLLLVDGAIFDMDGTLIDSLFFWDEFWKKLGAQYLGDRDHRPEAGIARAVRTMTYPRALLAVKEAYKITEESFLEEYLKFLKEFYATRVRPKEGAAELLGHLKAAGIQIRLASASHPQNLRIALRACGLLEYFDGIHSCEEVGAGKDRPDVFLQAAAAMGASRDRILVVEDSFLALETAKAAGFQTVGVYDRYSYDQERVRAASDLYLGPHDRLDDLMERIVIDQRRNK